MFNSTNANVEVFYVLLTVRLGVIFVNNQLHAPFFFMYVYFYSLRVSGSHVPIVRRFNCINTTSGIWLFGVQVWMSLIQTCTPSGELIVSIRHLVYVTLYRWPLGVQVWMSLIQTCTPSGELIVSIRHLVYDCLVCRFGWVSSKPAHHQEN